MHIFINDIMRIMLQLNDLISGHNGIKVSVE